MYPQNETKLRRCSDLEGKLNIGGGDRAWGGDEARGWAHDVGEGEVGA